MTSSNTPQRTRRRYLAAVAAVGSAVAAGCSGDTPGETRPPQNTTPGPNQSTRNDTDPTAPENSEAGLSDVVSPGEVTYGNDPNWRMYGHDTGNSFVNPHADGPSGDPSVQWTFEQDVFPTGSLMHHQPLIVDGTVYTCQFNDPNQNLTPVEDGNIVLFGIDAETGESETVFTTDGIWEEAGDRSGIVTDIVIYDGTVYLAGLGAVQAHDIDTGDELWTIPLDEPSIARPTGMRAVDDILIVADHQYSIDADTGEPTPRLCAIDLDTGEPLWTGPGQGRGDDNTAPFAPIVADGLVHHYNSEPVRDLRSGEKLATLPARKRPSLHDGNLYGLMSREDTSRLVSHSWETGHQRWEYTSEKGEVSTSPIAVDDTVVTMEDWVTGTAGEGRSTHRLCTGVDRETGERQWSMDYKSKADVEAEDLGPGSPGVASSETVYVIHGGGAATAVDPTDGAIEWQVIPDSWELSGGCALAEDLLVTIGAGGTLYGIS